jgi:hypothetical protein
MAIILVKAHFNGLQCSSKQRREDYQRLVEQHPFPDEQEQHGNNTNDGGGVLTPSATAITESAFDPLTI